MPDLASVGRSRKGHNRPSDVEVVQRLLNRHLDRPTPLATVLLLLLSMGIVSAAEPFCGGASPHSIDVWFDKMIASKTTTADIRAVQAEAHQRWDGVLNQLYKDVMAKLSGRDGEQFKQAQRNWLRFREAEMQFLSTAVYTDGTMAPVILSDIGLKMLKTRVCQLMTHLAELDK
jgi:uncharacterized protein YecT (DUF1311 family)